MNCYQSINENNDKNKEEEFKNGIKESLVKLIRAKKNENQNSGIICYSKFIIN